ncbi:MAG: site-specific integrase, partial [Planctomycetota bacterium]
MNKLRQARLNQTNGRQPRQNKNTTARWKEQYIEYLRSECHLSENTIAAYSRDIRKFNQWLKNRPIPKLTISQLS